MEIKSNNKTKTVIIVLVAVLVAGGAYYGYNRWQQQRLVNQYYQMLYAKQEATNAADEAEEAVKTPQDKFGEAEEAFLSGNVSALFDQVGKSEINAVFGGSKIIASTIGYYGTEGFAIQVMVPKKVTAEDFDALVNKFTDQGYQSAYGEITSDTGMIALQKEDGTMLTLAFDTTSDEQAITVMYATNQ